MSDLPEGWVRVSIADVILPYAIIDPTLSPAKAFDYIDIGAIDNRTQIIVAPKRLLGRDAPSRARRVAATGDILFSTVRTYLKNIAIVPNDLDGQLVSTGIAVLRPSAAIEGRYLFNFVRSEAFMAEISKAQDGTLYPAIAEKKLTSRLVPLAPLAEQKRIVGRVDGLLARTARADEELARIPALVAMYKASVLDAAFSGRLTADLRDDESSDSSALPAGWMVRSLGELGDIQGGTQIGKKREQREDLLEVPYLRVANVQRGALKLDEIRTVRISKAEKDRLLLKIGDILMNEGGDRDKLGRGWVWEGQIAECVHQNHVFRIRLHDNTVPPEFVSHYANECGQSYFLDQGTQTTNLASISKSKVAALPVPVPPFKEAIEIVHRITAAFTWLDRLTDQHASAHAMLPQLTNAVLAKAFRGDLATHAHSDEPAGVMLARMKARQATQVGVIGRQSKAQPRARKEFTQLAKTVEQVLQDAGDWLDAQAVFSQSGIADGASTEEVELVYAQLRALDASGRLEVNSLVDDAGRKTSDRIRLRPATHAS